MADGSMTLTKQLKTLRGQLDGVQKMIDDGKDCFDVLPQMKALKAGLERCIALYVEAQAQSCLGTKVPPAQQKKMHLLLKELSRS